MEGIIIAILVGWLLSQSMRDNGHGSLSLKQIESLRQFTEYEFRNFNTGHEIPYEYDGLIHDFRFGIPRDILRQTLNDLEDTSSKQFFRGYSKWFELQHIVEKMHPEYKVKIWLPLWVNYLCRWHIKEMDEFTKELGYMDFDVFIASRISENFELLVITKTIDDEFPVFIKEDYTKRDPENYPCFIN